MKFTVLYPTYRPGGYDILADSLSYQTCQDYELICVDEMEQRQAAASDYLRARNVKVSAVVASKPKCFPELAYGTYNAFNTGLLLSRGEYIIILDDYTWLPPDALEKFLRLEVLLKQGISITGIAIMMEDIHERHLDGMISIWDEEWKGDPLARGYKIHSVWTPEKYELFYSAFSYDLLVKMNGFPECYDSTLDNLTPLMVEIEKLGGGFHVDRANMCYMLNHREWGGGLWHIAKTMPTGSRQLIIRENTFDLKAHVRRTIENNGGHDMVQQPTVAPQQTTVTLPFKQGGKVMEIGGGDQPLFRPNLDMRKLPTVDYVCDLEERWPVPDREFDGVFSKFCIEHMSWRKVPHFTSECFRVLKPGGIAMMIGPNTLEQCKEIAKLNRIGIEESSLIFGGQEERGWNEHKAAFSPEYAIEVFHRAGFERVETEPWPGQIWTGARTDMIIRAYKAANAAYMKGDRHQWMRDQVKASESIIDLGCGPVPMWQGRGYNVKTVDERADFHPDIISKVDCVPLPDKTFDVVVLGDILEHYDSPPQLLNEAVRLAKKRIVITVPWEEKWSKNLNPFTHHDHKVNYTQSLLSDELAKMGYDFIAQEVNVDIEYIDKPPEHWSWVGGVVNLETKRATPPPAGNSKEIAPPASLSQQAWYKELEGKMTETQKSVIPGQRKLGLNIGSFTVCAKSTERTQWINYDILELSAYATQNGYEFSQLDARKGLPWPNDSVDFIIASHFLEHITRQEGQVFLKECLRVLKPSGVLRVTVPDTKLIAQVYTASPSGIKKRFDFNEGVKNAEDECEAFWNLLTAGHVTAFDEDSLGAKINEAGFTTYKCNRGTLDPERAKPVDSNSPEILADTMDLYPTLSLICEGVKLPAVMTGRPATVVVTGNVINSAEKLKIGLISTQFFGVPPKGYSGLEMIVWDLACGLSELGHTVTLFAPDGSKPPQNGKVVFTGPALQTVQVDWLGSEQAAYEIYKGHLGGLDILHGMNWFGFEYAAKIASPQLHVCHTHHGGLNADYWMKTKPPFPLNFMAISMWMTRVYAHLGLASKFVYNGINLQRYQFRKEKGDRLLFVGRFDTFKQPDLAIEIAKALGMGLDLVGGTFVQDTAYLEKIRSMCDGKQIVMYPDASHEVKVKLMQDARCLIFPSNMGEPFGLVAAEAMACGSAVVSTADGAIGEVVQDGVTGFVCKSKDEMIEAVKKIGSISPEACRKRVEENFSRQVMAKNYERLYREILEGSAW